MSTPSLPPRPEHPDVIRHDRPAPPPLASETVVVAAPMSYAGSAGRLWKLTRIADGGWQQVAVVAATVALIAVVWCFVTAWYLLFGLFLVPYRLIRRGQRKRQRQALQHREMLEAINRTR